MLDQLMINAASLDADKFKIALSALTETQLNTASDELSEELERVLHHVGLLGLVQAGLSAENVVRRTASGRIIVKRALSKPDKPARSKGKGGRHVRR